MQTSSLIASTAAPKAPTPVYFDFTPYGITPKRPVEVRRDPSGELTVLVKLTGGNVADCTAGAELLARMPACDILHGDKGYDSDAIRRQVENVGVVPNIPPKANRKWKNCFSPYLYRDRNAIERMFCRLKDFCRIATRYDRLAVNFLAAVHIAATVAYWL